MFDVQKGLMTPIQAKLAFARQALLTLQLVKIRFAPTTCVVFTLFVHSLGYTLA